MSMSMPGQGSPILESPCTARPWAARAIRGGLAALLTLCASLASAKDCDVRLRIAWGGGAAQSWQGVIEVTEGSLADATPLGLEADEPGSMHLQDARSLHILPRTARSYDGCDLHIQAPAS